MDNLSSNNPSGAKAYEVLVCSATRVVRTRSLEVRMEHGLEALANADTIGVPGIDPPRRPPFRRR